MSLYLSKLKLDASRRFVMSALGDCRRLHQTIMQAFPPLNEADQNGKAREQFGVLFRVDFEGRSGGAQILVQSGAEPDWAACGSLLGGLTNVEVKEISPIYENLGDGLELMFRLYANPTKRVSKKDEIAHPKFKEDKNRRRVEISRPEEQIEWLARKAEAHGFRLANVAVKETVANASATPTGKIHSRGANPLTFGTGLFEGVLQITDAERFKETLTGGIGQGKAYGFGLLSVARPLSF